MNLINGGKYMKILGISGSSRTPEASGVYKLVKIVLEATGQDYELISLRGKKMQKIMMEKFKSST